MEFIDPAIQEYAEKHTSDESTILREVNRHTHANVLRPRMLSGHLQGRLLSMLSWMKRPHRILELGTYTGYSALCLAEGLADEGTLTTIDVNEELEASVRTLFAKAGMDNKINFIVGNAVHIIPTLKENWDLVFIDADKENYSRYYDLVIDRVNLNGIILADNVLWSGKVLDEKLDKDTKAIVDFNSKIQRDPRVENVLLPVRDGITMMRKVKQ